MFFQKIVNFSPTNPTWPHRHMNIVNKPVVIVCRLLGVTKLLEGSFETKKGFLFVVYVKKLFLSHYHPKFSTGGHALCDQKNKTKNNTIVNKSKAVAILSFIFSFRKPAMKVVID